jgi:hypothetical protein
MSDKINQEEDPLWKRVWKSEGIRWLGPRGNGVPDAMERFQHGFECGAVHAATEFLQVAKDLAETSTAAISLYTKGERPPELVLGLFYEAAKEYDRIIEKLRDLGGDL